MTDFTTRQDLEAALISDYSIVRENPPAAGFNTFAARSRRDGVSVEVKAVPAWIFPGGMPVSDADLATRRVQHPNILPVLSTGRLRETFFWISPAIEGRTLRARLSRGGRMEIQDSLIVLRDVSAALTHAHLHGVLHGGLSPDSVVMHGGSALVSDLGIPEVFDALRKQPSVETAGAPEALRYASPEQANGGQADTRSDVYAWGVIAYELLSGRHPFAGRSTPAQMMAAHLEEEPAQLGTGAAGAPSGVSRFVMRCLSKDPSRRPETARDILALMTKEMLVPPPAPAAGSGQKLVMGLLFFAVVVIGVIAWFGMNP